MNSSTEYIKAVTFDHPECTPMFFWINDACWDYYGAKTLFDLMEQHAFLFPDFTRPQEPFTPNYALVARKDEPYVDDWGCLWETTTNGITGTVTKHPLANWDDFATYTAPNYETCMGIGSVDWKKSAEILAAEKAKGKPINGGLRHGHTFLQLCDILGYENFLYSMYDRHPLLPKLMDQLEEFNTGIINKYIDMNVDIMGYPEDLGMQNGPMISPDLFKRYIKPAYQRMMNLARDKDILVHMHSDGHLHALIDDIIEGGVQIINLQDLVNGIDWIAEKFAGKVCVDLDIDRQAITMTGSAKDIDELIEYEVKSLGSKAGGLIMTYHLLPGVPLENVKAIMQSMERHAFTNHS